MIYAKAMMDDSVRPMLLRLIKWKIGIAYDFQINVGKSGKFLAQLLSPQEYTRLLSTYADSNLENNWQALLQTLQLFSQLQIEVAKALDFSVNQTNAFAYILTIKNAITPSELPHQGE